MFVGNYEDLKKIAYSVVYEDLKERELGLFMGKFNPKVNNDSFMHGIYMVMAKITLNINDETYDDFFDTFTENMCISKESISSRINNIQKMYDKMGEDDETYDRWICLYPDEPSEDDIYEMANDIDFYRGMIKDYYRIQGEL